MADGGRYERLPEDPEEGLPLHEDEHDEALLGNEAPVSWAAWADLDLFFTRVYRYWEEKGYAVTLTARVLNLAALAFTILISAVLLLGVDYAKLQAECLRRDECDVWEAALRRHPLTGGLSLWNVLSVAYLAIFSGYWVFALAHLVQEARSLQEIRHFYSAVLGLSERAVRAATWPEVASRLVAAQRSVRLCIARDLTEHDIVARTMRRENYLIAMLNTGVLALNVPVPGLRAHVLLTKTMEWNLYWCILDPMFDAHFRVRPAFLASPQRLRRRLRVAALLNAALSPFLLVFLLIYFFMRNAEEVYHRPSTIGARRWSPAARWRLREFNELPHFLSHRLNAGHEAAERYCAQFPNHAASHVARFVAFVAGSVAALLIALTLADERLLERDLMGGRQTVWWLALLGVVLAGARALIIEQGTAAFDPGLALLEVAAHTHHLPRHWRGRAHTVEVQAEFQGLFRYRAALFLEELASVVLTPVLLWGALPRCAAAVLHFVERNTAHIEGVGDVCSMAAFDLRRHGNARYGSPCAAPKGARSRQGKMEKSLVSFAAAYPGWEAPPQGEELLSRIAGAAPAGGAPPGGASTSQAAGSWPAGLWSMQRSVPSFLPMYGLLAPHYPHLARLYAAQYSTVQQQRHQGRRHDADAAGASGGGDVGAAPPAQGGYGQRTAAAHGSERRAAVNGGGGSMFASAELLAPGAAGGAWEGPPLGTAEERVLAGQVLVQSYYEMHQPQPRAAPIPEVEVSGLHWGGGQPAPSSFTAPGAPANGAAAAAAGRHHSSELADLGARRE